LPEEQLRLHVAIGRSFMPEEKRREAKGKRSEIRRKLKEEPSTS